MSVRPLTLSLETDCDFVPFERQHLTAEETRQHVCEREAPPNKCDFDVAAALRPAETTAHRLALLYSSARATTLDERDARATVVHHVARHYGAMHELPRTTLDIGDLALQISQACECRGALVCSGASRQEAYVRAYLQMHARHRARALALYPSDQTRTMCALVMRYQSEHYTAIIDVLDALRRARLDARLDEFECTLDVVGDEQHYERVYALDAGRVSEHCLQAARRVRFSPDTPLDSPARPLALRRLDTLSRRARRREEPAQISLNVDRGALEYLFSIFRTTK